MGKPNERFRSEHKAFRARLRSIHTGAIGVAAREAMNNLKTAYRAAALEHWAELGNRASTGWGEIPEGDYQSSRLPEQCADSLADTLAHYFSQDPDTPPGTLSNEVSDG